MGNNNRQVVKDYPFNVFTSDREKDGKTFTIFSVSRSYKDKNGEWKHQTINLFSEDLLKLANICYQAYNDNIMLSKNSVPTKTEPAKDINDDLDDEIPF